MDFIKKEVVMNDDLDVHAIEVEIDHIKKELVSFKLSITIQFSFFKADPLYVGDELIFCLL